MAPNTKKVKSLTKVTLSSFAQKKIEKAIKKSYIMLKVCKKVKKISFYVKSWRPGQLEVVKLTRNMGDGS